MCKIDFIQKGPYSVTKKITKGYTLGRYTLGRKVNPGVRQKEPETGKMYCLIKLCINY